MSSPQFNLLPAIKLDFIRVQTTRRRIVIIASLVAAISFAILLIMLFSVEVVQRQQLNNASKSITSTTSSIQSQPQILQVLTVQNQLVTLVNLHANKHITSRVFDYLSQLTPNGVNLSRLSIDYSTNSMIIDGTADSATSVNQFVDTLKFTNYKLGDNPQAKTAFPSVVESSFNIGTSNVSYSLNVQFDPILFSNNQKDSSGNTVAPSLQVPNQITTRSQLFTQGGQ